MKLVWCRYDDYGFALHHGRGIYELKLKDKIIIIEWLGADLKYDEGRITGPELEELISDLCNDQNAQALWINANLDKVVIARVKEE